MIVGPAASARLGKHDNIDTIRHSRAQRGSSFMVLRPEGGLEFPSPEVEAIPYAGRVQKVKKLSV